MALATSRVESLPPISYVRTLPSAMTRAMADSRRVARSVSLSQSNISFVVKSIAIGFTLYWPEYFGAEPCVGSNTAEVSEQESNAKRSVGEDSRAKICKHALGQTFNKLRKRDQGDTFHQREPTEDRDQNSPVFRPAIVIGHDEEPNDDCYETSQIG